MTTFLNYSSYPQTPGTSSPPGTPMSGISTVAIKDGHEGIRHGHHHSGGVIDSGAAERLSRLGGFGSSFSTTSDGDGYFERVKGWREELGDDPPDALPRQQREEPTSYEDINEGSSGRDSSGGSRENDCDMEEDGQETAPSTSSGPNTPNKPASTTSKLVEKPKPTAKLPIPPRRAPGSYSTQIPNPPCSAPITPQAAPPSKFTSNSFSQLPSTQLAPNSQTSNNKHPSSSSSSTSVSLSGGGGGGNGLLTPYSTSAPSPASTVTTNSVREAKHQAKMLGPVTHDEGIIDTTAENGNTSVRSPSLQPGGVVFNSGDGDEMDLDVDLGPSQSAEGEGQGEGEGSSRRERAEEIEVRVVEG